MIKQQPKKNIRKYVKAYLLCVYQLHIENKLFPSNRIEYTSILCSFLRKKKKSKTKHCYSSKPSSCPISKNSLINKTTSWISSIHVHEHIIQGECQDWKDGGARRSEICRAIGTHLEFRYIYLRKKQRLKRIRGFPEMANTNVVFQQRKLN